MKREKEEELDMEYVSGMANCGEISLEDIKHCPLLYSVYTRILNIVIYLSNIPNNNIPPLALYG